MPFSDGLQIIALYQYHHAHSSDGALRPSQLVITDCVCPRSSLSLLGCPHGV